MRNAARAFLLVILGLIAARSFEADPSVVLRSMAVWTAGEPIHTHRVVIVIGNRIAQVGPMDSIHSIGLIADDDEAVPNQKPVTHQVDAWVTYSCYNLVRSRRANFSVVRISAIFPGHNKRTNDASRISTCAKASCEAGLHSHF